MFGSNILEVAIGIIFIYLLLSLICTALNEGIASLFDKRGKNLLEGIKNLLNDPKFTGLAQQVYNHGLIGGISQYASNPGKRTRLPSYMSPTSFSLALLDILAARGVLASKYGDLLTNAESADDAHEEALEAAAGAPNDPALAQAVNQTKAAREQARTALETVAAEAKAAHEQAVQAANAAPGDANLAKLAVEARNTMDGINAAVKMLDARRAAVASAKNPKEVKLLLAAGTTLKEALAFARDFAAGNQNPLGNIQEGLRRLPEGHTKETLLVLVDKTRREVTAIENQAEAFRENLEGWFISSMERVGGWYKRWTQRILLWLAAFLVIASNADTVMLVKRISNDNVLRASLVAAAADVVKAQSGVQYAAPSRQGTEAVPAPKGKAAEPVTEGTATRAATPSMGDHRSTPDLQLVLDTAANLELPIGWSLNPDDPGYFRSPKLSLEYAGWAFYKLFGLLISVLAVSLGAPFWFDLLSKVVNLRSAGTPPGETSKSAGRPAARR